MKRLGAIVVLAALLGLFISCFVALSHASTTARIQSQALGINESYTNPNTYLLGAASGDVIKTEDGHYYTRVIFQPFGTYQLYRESVLFCGNAEEKFNGKHNPVVVTYETSAHRLYQGEACHILLGVFEVTGQ